MLTILEFSSVVVDIISAIGFDKSGDNLAIGDRGGRVIIFERNDRKDVRICYTFKLVFVLSLDKIGL